MKAAHNRLTVIQEGVFPVLYKFKSKDAADVIMLETNGRHLLESIGKDAGPKGIIQAAQIPAALAALHAAISAEESAHQEDGHVPAEGVGLRQRAVPFIDMLERSAAAGHDVVWGV
jgi:Domain of unknown function (DUF1840)